MQFPNWKQFKALFAVALTVCMLGCHKNPTVTTEEIERQIQKELGTNPSKTQVVKFLQAHSIQFSDLDFKPTIESDFEQFVPNQKKALVTGYIVSIIRNVESSTFVEWSISIHFYFDKDGKLVHHTVHKIGTGP